MQGLRGQHFRRSVGQPHGIVRRPIPLVQVQSQPVVVGVGVDFVFCEEFGPVVAAEDGCVIVARLREEFAAVNGEGSEDKCGIG